MRSVAALRSSTFWSDMSPLATPERTGGGGGESTQLPDNIVFTDTHTAQSPSLSPAPTHKGHPPILPSSSFLIWASGLPESSVSASATPSRATTMPSWLSGF